MRFLHSLSRKTICLFRVVINVSSRCQPVLSMFTMIRHFSPSVTFLSCAFWRKEYYDPSRKIKNKHWQKNKLNFYKWGWGNFGDKIYIIFPHFSFNLYCIDECTSTHNMNSGFYASIYTKFNCYIQHKGNRGFNFLPISLL